MDARLTMGRREFIQATAAAVATAASGVGLAATAASATGAPATGAPAAGAPAAGTAAATKMDAADKPKPLRLGVIGVGGRGTYLLGVALQQPGVEVPALCDIDEGALGRAQGLAAKARDGRTPEGYSRGPKDYQRMLRRDDLDAVLVATPMQIHAPICIDALRAGKAALSEVAAAMTLDDCWGLVRAAEETGKTYMLSENCCYWPGVMAIGTMVKKGLFGRLTYAECGYVHDCRSLSFGPGGQLTWRGELHRDFTGNLYPTHSLGPVAQWLGINRGDRMVSLVASGGPAASMSDYVERHFPPGHAARQIKFQAADTATVLIRTAKGAMIDLRYDISSPRPHPSTTYYSLQGLRASYESRIDSIWVDGRSKGEAWEPFGPYAAEFEHPLWKAWRTQAAGTGHEGGDFFVIHEFLQCLRGGTPPPIDAADAAAWSCVIPLSGKSIREGSTPQEIPDFTKGKWEKRTT